MTQEEKDLLLKDLCARLPYKVMAHYKYYDFVGSSERVVKEGDGYVTVINMNMNHPIKINWNHVTVYDCEPYLRPTSSMTEEEKKTYSELFWNHDPEHVDWLNEHMFDYRGLIEKGLALEAPEGMYKNEKIEFEL